MDIMYMSTTDQTKEQLVVILVIMDIMYMLFLIKFCISNNYSLLFLYKVQCFCLLQVFSCHFFISIIIRISKSK